MDADALKLAIDSLEGDFELVKELGQGATAVVYLLRDHGLDRDVALKVIRGGMGSDDEAVARLQREAHLVAQLQHPNIVKLFGTHRLPDGSFALLMEHVPGRNLKEIIRKEGALPIPRVLEVLKDVTSALAYAHRRRIVHRDVKPENIYIDEEVGTARLADFGVARPWDQDSRLTIPGASLGTPAYMSPEQIDGQEVDGRSDVYSLGLVGYEMILGRHPWEGENVFTTIFKQKKEFLDMNLPGLDRAPALAEILERALRKDPEDRWESTDALLRELKGVVVQGPAYDPDPFEAFLARGGNRSAVSSEARSAEGPKVRPGEEAGGEESEAGKEDLPPIDWSGLEAPAGIGQTLDLTVLDDQEVLPEEPQPVAKREKPSLPRWIIFPVALAVALFAGYFLLPREQGGQALETIAPAPERPGPENPPPQPQGEAVNNASLMALNGGRLEGQVGATAPLVMRASRPDGAALPGRTALFEVVEGEGVLEVQEVQTDETGLAEVTLQLPERAQDVVVRGTLPGVDASEATFRIRALPGPPAGVSRLMGDGQTGSPGTPLPDLVGIRVRDAFGNPVQGTLARFQVLEGGGAVRPGEVQTDEAGRAFARWTLGTQAGGQALVATVPGAQESVITFRATAEVPLQSASEESAPDQPAEEELPPAPLRVPRRSVAVGGSFVCSLRASAPDCRGGIEPKPGDGSGMGGLQALSAGVSHGCGLTQGGMAWCWGANESGQLGDGTTQDRSSAVQVDTPLSFSLLAAGLSHTCGLDARGAAYCWGRNLNGQLGDRSRQDRSIPGGVQGNHAFQSLSAGWNHTCGLTGTGQLYCWGLNGDSQVGDGTRVDRLVPTRVPGVFQSVVAGSGHTCGISGSRVLCWGSNRSGQLGTGGAVETSGTPVQVQGLPSSPESLAAGAVHTCALLSGGQAYCWGQNLHGQLGDGTTENRDVPVQVSGGHSFTSLQAGGAVTCGSTEEGARYCWGMNQSGQLGDGTRVNRSVPTRIGGGSP